MIKVCKCGKRRTIQPFKDARKIKFICDACKLQETKVVVLSIRERVERVLNGSHGEIGRRKGLKIPRS